MSEHRELAENRGRRILELERELAEARASFRQREAEWAAHVEKYDAYAERMQPAVKLSGLILDAFAENWGADFDGQELQEMMDGCGLIDTYPSLTADEIDRLASHGHDMMDFDVGDTYYAYSHVAEAIRHAALATNPATGSLTETPLPSTAQPLAAGRKPEKQFDAGRSADEPASQPGAGSFMDRTDWPDNTSAERIRMLNRLATDLRKMADLCADGSQESLTLRVAADVIVAQSEDYHDARRALVATMVDRFLGWPLPKDFGPDAGISFTPSTHPMGWPVGTNLFTADQARAMFEHALGAQNVHSQEPSQAAPDVLRDIAATARAAINVPGMGPAAVVYKLEAIISMAERAANGSLPKRRWLSEAAWFLGLDSRIPIPTPYGTAGEMIEHIILKARDLERNASKQSEIGGISTKVCEGCPHRHACLDKGCAVDGRPVKNPPAIGNDQ